MNLVVTSETSVSINGFNVFMTEFESQIEAFAAVFNSTFANVEPESIGEFCQLLGNTCENAYYSTKDGYMLESEKIGYIIESIREFGKFKTFNKSNKLVFVGTTAYTRNLDKQLVIADEVSTRLALINGQPIHVGLFDDLQKAAEQHAAVVNQVQKIRACDLFVWHVNGKAMLARCTITNRFVSRANAQHALNIVLSNGNLYSESRRLAVYRAEELRHNANDCRSIIERNSVNIEHRYLKRLSAEYRKCIRQLTELMWAL